MRVLVTISILSFCVLAWAALAIMRHIRRTTATVSQTAFQTASPIFAAALPNASLAPSATRKLRPQSPQRPDRTFASHDDGHLEDPGARQATRPSATNPSSTKSSSPSAAPSRSRRKR